jgi:hypothetical protein
MIETLLNYADDAALNQITEIKFDSLPNLTDVTEYSMTSAVHQRVNPICPPMLC